MNKILYLHIGTKKTGTTSIQHSIMNNIGALEKQGFFVTKQFGDLMANGFYRTFNQPEDKLDQSIIDAAMAQLKSDVDEKFKIGANKTIISAESLTDLRPEGIALAHKALMQIFDEVKILLYIRRQDLCASSHYSTALRGGGASKALMSTRFGPGRRAVQYKKLVDDWGHFFGIDNIVLRIFERDFLKDGNSVEDFYQIVGADTSSLAKTPQQNTSFSPEALAFLRLYNETVSEIDVNEDRDTDQARKQLVKLLENVSSGSALKPSREVAKKYYEQFEAGNEYVRKNFFPDRPTLFNMDFSSYPEKETTIDSVTTPEVIMEQFVKVWLQGYQKKS